MSSSPKHLCIHGHFYQPPRENAWLEVIELQDSAAPFHDWNERINYECYAPNAAARILDGDEHIKKIVNNYSKISFNFGPTLLSWMHDHDPITYRRILEADKISAAARGGHGNALAQAHSHLILPLCNARDKRTQVIWGIRDFEFRFGRKPEGMWLAETAADTASLEVLAEQGIRFTVLAPRQAKGHRKIGEEDWTYYGGIDVDTTRPYWCHLPSGKKIALFFYDGNVSQGVAFEGLLNNGAAFADRLSNAYRTDRGEAPQLMHIATDGESYGHHHRFGEMALADCLDRLEQNPDIHLTNYGEYLEKFPPEYEIQIHENSSWSCVHGVERWRSNCGCHTGGHGDWTQAWRGPLRETLDWLRDTLIPVYEREATPLLTDPWAARDAYIDVVLHRRDNSPGFLESHQRRPVNKEEQTRALRLLEMQRNALYMYTSCGWFFDEISGIETNQILQYANRAIHYAAQVGGEQLHEEFIRRLEAAPSNVMKNGAESYRQNVMPARVNLTRVAMHFAASSLFEKYPDRLEFFNYIAESEVLERIQAGAQVLNMGRMKLRSKVTFHEQQFSFAVVYLGQQNLIGNLRIDMDQEQFAELRTAAREAFELGNISDVIGLMQEYFGSERFTIWHLFRDEKRKILKRITSQAFRRAEASVQDIYEDNYQLMNAMDNSGIPLPEAWKNAVQFIVNNKLQRFFTHSDFDVRRLKTLLNEVKKWEVEVTNEQRFNLVAGEGIFREVKRLLDAEAPVAGQLQRLNEALELLPETEVEINYWRSQNHYYDALCDYQEGRRQFENPEWRRAFVHLGHLLQIRPFEELV